MPDSSPSSLPRQGIVGAKALEESLFRSNEGGAPEFRKALTGSLRDAGVKLDTREYDGEGRYIGDNQNQSEEPKPRE
jgi:hypothetical protein